MTATSERTRSSESLHLEIVDGKLMTSHRKRLNNAGYYKKEKSEGFLKVGVTSDYISQMVTAK